MGDAWGASDDAWGAGGGDTGGWGASGGKNFFAISVCVFDPI